jgi:hypothetical protein
MFAVSSLGLTPSLSRCLVTTSLIESPYSGVRLRTRRVLRWRDGKMVLRWAASALLITERHFNRIMGYRDLRILKAALGPWVGIKPPLKRRWRRMKRTAAHVQRFLGHHRARAGRYENTTLVSAPIN